MRYTTTVSYRKSIFASMLLAFAALLSNGASAGLMNANFSAGFDDWQGVIIGAPNPASETVIDPDNYPLNYSSTLGSATLTTGNDTIGIDPNDIWSVVLFQDFMLTASAPGSSFELSLDVASLLSNTTPSIIEDFAFAQLRDLDANISTLDLSGGGSHDITSWVGVNATLEFGVQDFDFVPGDTLTVSNLSIVETVAAVPEPSSLLLFGLGLAGLWRKRRCIRIV